MSLQLIEALLLQALRNELRAQAYVQALKAETATVTSVAESGNTISSSSPVSNDTGRPGGRSSTRRPV